jgi:hypothetical protein
MKFEIWERTELLGDGSEKLRVIGSVDTIVTAINACAALLIRKKEAVLYIVQNKEGVNQTISKMQINLPDE